jgi:endonuclease-3
MQNADILKVIPILRKECKQWEQAIVTQYANLDHDPYKILISTLISLRTKDKVTHKASDRLFNKAPNPYIMNKLTEEEIKKLIYPAGFYKTKAKKIKDITKKLVEEYNGVVPDNINELMKFNGIGRKTANLVVILGYDKPGICVDTHVHRITNRWGYVNTKNPDKTEKALREKLPKEYWKEINDLLVVYGQNLCKPVSPFCSKCKIDIYCDKIGVDKHR